MPRKPFGGKPPPPLAVSDDVEDATDLSKGLATVSVQRQGSFSLSETMTFDSEDIKLRGARGMELSGGDSASSVTLQDLDRLRQLGSGATSRVFLARHRTTGQMLALKELTSMANWKLPALKWPQLLLCLLRARLAALDSSVLPERGPATGTPATASGAQASCVQRALADVATFDRVGLR